MNEYRLADMVPGLAASFEVEITGEMMEKFLAITGDVNPLHASEEFARARGHAGRVVYGMLTASFYSTLVGVHLPGRHALLQGVDASFNKPVAIGDRLTVRGEVGHVNEAYGQVEIKASISNQDGAKVSKATIKTGVYE